MDVMQKINLRHGKQSDSSVTLVPFGATIISWIAQGQEAIFVSNTAVLDGSKPIRGGVPVCFPNFGPWTCGPQHGFARNSREWTVKSGPVTDEATGDVKIILELQDSAETRQLWNHKFTLLYSITLKADSLHLGVDVKNNGEHEFDMTFCFHTYLRTSDLASVNVSNLKNVSYTDKTQDGQPQVVEDQEEVSIKGFTDRVYANAPDELSVHLGPQMNLKVVKANMDDYVVWNPYETASKMADMHENGYLEFVCVEATQASKRIIVQPGSSWQASHSFTKM